LALNVPLQLWKRSLRLKRCVTAYDEENYARFWIDRQRWPNGGRMRAVLILLILGLTIAVANSASARPAASGDLAAIDAYVAAQMSELRVPGLALAIVQGDQIVYLKGYGVANPAGDPVTAQMPFSIGSLTKSFTALAIMQLVEAGRLELDAPVRRYLPWFQVADDDASLKITLRHLLTHTAGLPRDLATSGAPEDEQRPERLEARLRDLRAVELEQPLGTYGYSNAGYMVLAMVIQQVTGQSYEAYIGRQIFAPLGMSRSFGSLDAARQRGPATGYHYWFGQPVAAGEPSYRAGPGNGGLFASAEDMARYLIFHLNDGRMDGAAIVSPAGLAELHRPAVARPDGHYAMGWAVRTDGGRTTLSHSGQTYNYFAKMILAPDSDLGVVVLQNSQYTVRLLAGDTRQDVIADGVLSLMLGDTPASLSGQPAFGLIYGGFALVGLAQIAGMIRSALVLRRWRSRPGERPRGRRRAWRIGLPLALNLGWAALVLIGLPAAVNLSEVGYQIPDLTYALLASGAVALAWAAIRTTWALQASEKDKG
jgi:CubicO group peptidase (beta-lactamase class C family)